MKINRIIWLLLTILIFAFGAYRSYETNDWALIGSMGISFSICFILGRISR